jgi:hypothetical protein
LGIYNIQEENTNPEELFFHLRNLKIQGTLLKLLQYREKIKGIQSKKSS